MVEEIGSKEMDSNKSGLRIRADFNQREVVLPHHYDWVSSPEAGVSRMMLDRIGDERARATSIVHYEANAGFSSHIHSGGEEFFVISGVFADEHGEYPAGTYVRNPIGTSHTPSIGSEGATIFVKLQQFDIKDSRQLAVNTRSGAWRPGLVDGLSVLLLHDFDGEHVALVKWEPFCQFNAHTHWGGEEILVLKGTFYDEYGAYPKGSWIRNPHLSEHRPFTKEEGALIYVKVGHLLESF